MKKNFVLILCFTIVLPAFVFASESNVPQVLSFQSLFFDDGGNPVADGDVGATFRIIDVAGSVVYEEHQTMRAAGGFASALIGNGIAANGAPAGPISNSIFDADGPFYLEVQLDGGSPMQAMEIASVPFAMRSDVALRVADGAIESKAIADGGVSFEDISSKAVEEIAKAVTGGRDTSAIVFREDLETMYRTPNSASSIGVKPDLIYSGSNNLQDVLTDLDRSIKARDERMTGEIEERKKVVDLETTAREAAINSEALLRERGDSDLGTTISNEVANRNAAIATEVASRNTAITGAIAAEVANRNTAIGTEAANRNAAISEAVGTEVANRNTAIGTEVTNRNTAIAAAIVTESANRNTAIAEAEARANTAVGNAVAAQAAQATQITQVDQRVTALAPQLASAWGSVRLNGPTTTMNFGYNVGLAELIDNGGDSTIDVLRFAFATPLPSANYVIIFSRYNNSFGGATTPIPVIEEKTENGFRLGHADLLRGPANVDFMVVGPAP